MTMQSRTEKIIADCLTRWVSAVNRNPWTTIFISFIATLAAMWYISGHLGIITDNAGMMSRDLHYLKVYNAYKKEFPHQNGTVIIVIDGITPDIATDARDRFYSFLKESGQAFDFIFAPGSQEFFRQNGLMYLDTEELEKIVDDLSRSAPLLSSLAEKPDLENLFGLLDSALRAGEHDVSLDLEPAFREFAKSIRGVNSNRFIPVSWMALMGNGSPVMNGSRQFIMIQPRLDYHKIMPASELMKFLRKSMDGLGLTPENGVRIRLTGDIAMEYEELQSVTRGAEKAGMLSFVMVAVVIFAGLGSGRFVLATLLTLITGLVWTAWFAAVSIGHLNMISVAFAVLFIGLSVDYSIHFCLHFRELLEKSRNGGSSMAVALALSETASTTGVSLLICAVTTATGFFAFTPTSFTGVAELGLISGAGMFIGFAATMTLIPAFLTVMPCNYRDRTGQVVNRAVRAFSMLPVKYPGNVLAVTIIGLTVSPFFIKNVEFDDNPLNLRDQSCESVTAFKELLKGKDSPWTLNVVVDTQEKARELALKLKKLPSVKEVLTFRSFLPDNQQKKMEIVDEAGFIAGDIQLHDETSEQTEPDGATIDSIRKFTDDLGNWLQKAENRSPGAMLFYRELRRFLSGNREDMNARLALMKKAFLVSFPGRIKALGESLNASSFTIDDLPDDLKSMWISPRGRIRLEIIPAEDMNIKSSLKKFIREVKEIAPDATGFPVHMTEGGNAVVESFQEAFLLSAICISLFLFATMPSFSHALLAMLPLAAAAIFTGAVMDMAGLSLNFANIIGLPLILGIGVDNGIHMVYRFAIIKDRKSEPFSIVTNRGIIFSGLTTICSFGNLAVSAHNGMAGMGIILTIGVTCTMISTLLVLPALLVWQRNLSGAFTFR